MKVQNFTPLTILLFSCLVYSCSTARTIDYIGESYAPSEHVEIFYDVKQVKKEFKIIGRMSVLTMYIESTHREMIKKAKSVGADAIIFTDLSAERYDKESNGSTIKAEVIRYLKFLTI